MKRVLSVTNLLLCTIIIYFSVDMFYKIVSARLDPGAVYLYSHPKPVEMETDKPLPISAYQAFADRNLFGLKIETEAQPSPREEQKPVAVEGLEKTGLKLKLWGTVTGDEERAYAVIEDEKKREQNLYRSGDTIQDATVKLILREKVVLHVDGKDEILAMEKMESGTPSRTPGRAPGPSPTPVPRSFTRKLRLNRSHLLGALEDVDTMMKQARFRPHFKDGKSDGLLLTGIKPNSIFRKMGLRNGDVIMGVDENDVKSVDDAMKLYENIKSSSSAKLQIRRRGRTITMEYAIQ